MKTTGMRIGLTAALLASVILCLGWADSWHELKQTAGTVTTISAEFTQKKHMQILARPLVSRGIFKFRAPDALRWEYQHPIRSILLTDAGHTKRYVQSGTQLVEDATANLQSMQMVVQEITQWLNGRFDQNPAFNAHLMPNRKIVLTPKDAAMTRLIERIEIVLADRPAVIQSVLIFESADSYTQLDFKNVVLNQPLDGSVFRNGS